MSILDVITGAWAITPEKLEQIQSIYHARIHGLERDQLEALQTRATSGSSDRQAYQIRNGVAVLGIDGPIAQRMSMFHAISGGASTDLLAQDLQAALDDPMVDAIVLRIDSPGGAVSGTQALADKVRAARGVKPIAAWTDATMASAAYWIGSAAEAVYIEGNTTQVGSIGVVAAHRDFSRAEDKAGIKTTEIYAGKYKRIASQYEPLTPEGRADIQATVDYYYGVFVGAVAEQRGVSVEDVLTKMADGKIFIGKQAVDAGLVDGVASLDEVIAKVANQAETQRAARNKEKYRMITKDQLQAENPDLVKEIQAEAAAAALAAERTRLEQIDASALPGHEDLVAQMKADGTSASDAAMKILAAERARQVSAAADRLKDAPDPLPNAGAPADEKPTLASRHAQATKYASEKGVAYIDAYRALFGNAIA